MNRVQARVAKGKKVLFAFSKDLIMHVGASRCLIVSVIALSASLGHEAVGAETVPLRWHRSGPEGVGEGVGEGVRDRGRKGEGEREKESKKRAVAQVFRLTSSFFGNIFLLLINIQRRLAAARLGFLADSSFEKKEMMRGNNDGRYGNDGGLGGGFMAMMIRIMGSDDGDGDGGDFQ